MTLHDLTQPLEDSIALNELAVAAGITREQAKRFMARLADTDPRLVIRLSKTCHAEEQRERAKQLRQR